MQFRWLIAGLCLLASILAAPIVRADDIVVSGAVASITPTGSGGVFMIIHNHGAAADRLVAISTNVARKTELHATEMDEGIMRMRPVETVEVPPDGMIALEPGGTHIMLFGVTEKLNPGDAIELTLGFEKAGDVKVNAEVRAPGSVHQHTHD